MSEDKASKIKELNQIRSQYLPVADRIRIRGEQENHEREQFWLTRRMLSQVLPHIVSHLEKQLGDKMEAVLVDVKASLAKHQSDQNAIRWSDTKADKSGSNASLDDPEKSSNLPWLVLKVGLLPTTAGCRLLFTGEQGQQAAITLGASALCRWLVVLHSQSLQANWHLSQWPPWIASLQVEQQPVPGLVLH